MPNWCQGTVGIRGKRDDVLKFLKEGFERYKYDGETNKNVLVSSNIFKMDEAYNDEDDWTALSSKYHLDFNLYGIECGM